MADPGGRGRSVLRLPRVEFDLAALLLGAVSVVAYTIAWPILASLLQVRPEGKFLTPGGPVDAPPGAVLRSSFFTEIQRVFPAPGLDRLLGLLGAPGPLVRASETTPNSFEQVRPDVPAWKLAVVAAALLLLWSVVGGALARAYALRKARDESVAFGDALGFSLGNLGQLVKAPLFAVAAGVMFTAIVLACGAASAVPWAGPVLQLIAQPVAVLATLVAAVVIGLGLVFGFPMLTAAVAVERNGSLDAVSRTFSYVWTRPVTFGISSLIVLAVAGVIDAVANWVVGTSHVLFLTSASWVDADLAKRMLDGMRASQSLGSPATDGISASAAASVWIAWAVAAVAGFLARGFVVSYVVGGVVDVYFMLREEVDGIDPGEVFVEGVGGSLGDPVPGEPRNP